jgi:hypothetical protein
MRSTLAKYALSLEDASDIYAPKWRTQLLELLDSLPQETARCMRQELELLGQVQDHINQLEARIKERIKVTESMQLVKTLPGVGTILAIVIDLEIGSVDRFRGAARSAAEGPFRPEPGQLLRARTQGQSQRRSGPLWTIDQTVQLLPEVGLSRSTQTCIEAANVVVMKRNHPRWRRKHVSVLYDRIRRRKGHRSCSRRIPGR